MYQRIMDDVIENCQTTFEEDGVNQQTLDDLRKVGLPLHYHSSWSILCRRLALLLLAAAHQSVLRFKSKDTRPANDISN